MRASGHVGLPQLASEAEGTTACDKKGGPSFHLGPLACLFFGCSTIFKSVYVLRLCAYMTELLVCSNTQCQTVWRFPTFSLLLSLRAFRPKSVCKHRKSFSTQSDIFRCSKQLFRESAPLQELLYICCHTCLQCTRTAVQYMVTAYLFIGHKCFGSNWSCNFWKEFCIGMS